ncbi:hypothetical protein H6P81_002711 [Aristolochia fimbriata]|uniref:Reverse transcriptase domain-containing protein n=1 Tax=Aristolochia fimbriata TaxID=158543 RepID=A0AAV7FB76_ARIFI|nr:hypothetical protein H6P81_002711 [Aristolochia fimbriata]
MPFGLKNANSTYQKAMQNIFDDFLHKRVECYVDDLVVKKKVRADHLLDLRVVFERLRRFQLKMNSLKCAFDVTSGKFLGFVIHHWGIKIDQTNIDAIQNMPESRNISELKRFQGHLAYIRRFISNLAERCQPFSRLMKKDVPFDWDDACRNAFNSVKAYLTKPPMLVAPIVNRPLLLYIAVEEKSITGEFEIKKVELVPFWKHAGNFLPKIPQASLHFIQRTRNGPADALAGIAASLAQFNNLPCQVPICDRWVVPLVPLPIEEEEKEEREEKEESLPISIRDNEAQIGANQSQIFSDTARSQ